MKSIAILTGSLNGGGAERSAANMSIILEEAGYRVYLFTDTSFTVGYAYNGTLVNFVFHIDTTVDSPELAWKKKIQELRDMKERYEIDLCISFLQIPNYLNLMSKENEKIILTTHSVNSIYANADDSVFVSRDTYTDLYQYADLVTFPSDYCRNDWIKNYGDLNGITRLLYNPMLELLKNENCFEKRDKVIIFVGRLHAIKRPWHVIEAFEIASKKLTDYKLLMLGDGPAKNMLTKMIHDKRLDEKVTLLGNVEDVNKYMSKARLMIMTSYCEAMPCSLLEALNAGLPVISCDSPGGIREELDIRENIDFIQASVKGKGGIITPYINEGFDNTKQITIMADQIVEVLSDNELWHELSLSGRENVQKFTSKEVASKWVEAITGCGQIIDKEKFEVVKSNSYMLIKEKNNQNKMKMYQQYYYLLEKWMLLHEKSKTASAFFLDKAYKNIILYGDGKMAKHLIHDISNTDIRINCIVDKNAINKVGDFTYITGEFGIPDADCIIVTVTYQFDEIKEKLEQKTDMPIISLSEVIDYCNER